jgi:hypothetical protein
MLLRRTTLVSDALDCALQALHAQAPATAALASQMDSASSSTTAVQKPVRKAAAAGEVAVVESPQAEAATVRLAALKLLTGLTARLPDLFTSHARPSTATTTATTTATAAAAARQGGRGGTANREVGGGAWIGPVGRGIDFLGGGGSGSEAAGRSDSATLDGYPKLDGTTVRVRMRAAVAPIALLDADPEARKLAEQLAIALSAM